MPISRPLLMTEPCHCPKCGWQGKLEQANAALHDLVRCPRCNESVLMGSAEPVMQTKIDMTNGPPAWLKVPCRCAACNWTGTVSDTRMEIKFFQNQLHCPRCDQLAKPESTANPQG